MVKNSKTELPFEQLECLDRRLGTLVELHLFLFEEQCCLEEGIQSC